ncbi:indolepyruvate ferredoxin oxidoreductase family protein [Candidimonas sp. SYP-B2681]|uniref:indolepyruvate ferredoxin oxidoreductase family protein n=1 Tax=Candidimonas sp. SYP-B2681 TaxID=2497686 RepID=UPI000F89BA2B|nr:indolepyruvate ferredoxin oxidoreductase family protein [Candidimonas sp. SYP-B2681]RTZ39926.1 indolepyruvate ferredoxin oxidoreductase family protein [Candidimonas sp. SYP-B2681]
MPATTIASQYQLADNLTATSGRIFLTGTQALIRMLLAQRRADQQHGLNTAGFVTGYRGSPLAGVDLAMWRAQNLLNEKKISFLPAINEDLGATIVMGTQQAGVREDRSVDGVFAMWYGKGPGVDRAGDALHHGNAAGASKQGGVLLIVGDDHTAASSSIPHASEASLAAWSIPIVHPASVDEYELFGLWGWALSRYSGAWVAFKAVTETVESGRSFMLEPMPDLSSNEDDHFNGALEYSAREFLTPGIENRIAERLLAVNAFSRKHSLDRIVNSADTAKLGIVSTGKAYLDTLDALKLLAEDGHEEGLPPLRHYKIGLSWPMDPAGFARFATGLEHILVVEEKGPLIEGQIKDLLFNQAVRPSVSGKRDLENAILVPATGQLRPALVANCLRRWLKQTIGMGDLESASELKPALPGRPATLSRRPYFCSGCPHSTSTKVPEGSQALAGVGCHYMATWMNRETSGLTQMGGEGTDWIGLSRYIRMPHIFQNMGEGTYFHSGYLAIRQAVAANANITYKILFNDAVAMTGGQPVDGTLSVPQICQQMLGEGVKRVVITTDDPAKYQDIKLADGVSVHERHELDRLQRELREIEGVTVLIHDQVCAAEKRRRRKKKSLPDPARRLFINTAVCEGCGDCGTQSNCLSLVPVETPFGRKRAIDQSSCNKDYSCLDGFCPSFVSVIGGSLRKGSTASKTIDRDRVRAMLSQLPPPAREIGAAGCNILVAGIGGTGVITVGAILSMAAHLEGRAASVLDITGLAQKGGTVISHIRLSESAQPTGAVRIDAQQADVAIFCDAVAATSEEALKTLRRDQTVVALNTYLAPTAEFTHNPQINLDARPFIDTVRATAGSANTWLLNAHSIAEQQFGDSILANMMMLGFAWQRGGIPLSEAAIMQALRLNGVAVELNQQAFLVGRLAAWQPAVLDVSASVDKAAVIAMPESLETIVKRCRAALTGYQDAAYAQEYTDVVEAVLAAEQTLWAGTRPRLAVKVAQSLYKLMAYKDEYEVARLFTNGDFHKELHEKFEGDFSLRFHLAPPLLGRRDPATGVVRKMTFGPGTEKIFKVLARGKLLRGSWLDIFSYTAERKMERRLIKEYRLTVLNMISDLRADNFSTALELAELPQMVRGYGHIKAANVAHYERQLAQLRSQLKAPVMDVNPISRANA